VCTGILRLLTFIAGNPSSSGSALKAKQIAATLNPSLANRVELHSLALRTLWSDFFAVPRRWHASVALLENETTKSLS
jgi:hypothetical protein